MKEETAAQRLMHMTVFLVGGTPWYPMVLMLILGSLKGLSAQSPPSNWINPAHEQKIDSLLEIMTLEEKVGQMTLFTSDWDQTGPTLREGYRADVTAGKVGAIFNAHTAAYNQELQRLAVEETRLGIPLLFGYDVIHGYRTIFPVPLGEAASWNLAAAEESARIAATEAAAAGLHWTFAPMVDIARDPRWGRVMEGAGEDVYLGSLMAAARVRGFQGQDLADPFTIIACAKHFAAYGAAQAGRDYHTVDISERVLRETYLAPFKAALDAGVRSFMTGFNEIDGLPVTGNDHLLTEILREEWGFNGFVVSDYTSINEMVKHGVAAELEGAAELAVEAGLDMDMQGAAFYDHLLGLVQEGRVLTERIDDAVRSILRIKYALGLFADPYRYSDERRESNHIFTEAHRAAARRIARESIVLLQNEKEILPLSTDIDRLAVIGPLADSQADMLGAWHADGRAEDCVSLLTGLRQAVGEEVKIDFSPGTSVSGQDRASFSAALAAARRADAIVVAVGENWWMSGEAASRADIRLPGLQSELVQELAALGKPLVVVLFNGRPLAIPEIAELPVAILEAWHPGTEGGHAIADVLFGRHNPCGKLPITFPRAVGQIPIFYYSKNTGRPLNPDDKYTSKYLDESNSPLFPFGFGLSYTTFDFSTPTIDQATINRNGTVTVSVEVTNSGQRAGVEVVQLYLQDLVGSVTRPVRELKAFERVELAPGESRTISLTLNNEDLSFLRRDMSFGSEPGRFRAYIGNHSDATTFVEFSLD
ncbi:MAG: glycoside hydrolase family 3 N-terminal domain-containing protein [Bacteroidota bacterium]